MKKVMSVEEQAKAEEERTRPFRMEIADVGNVTFSIKSPILLSKDKLDLLKKICGITDDHLERYIKEKISACHTLKCSRYYIISKRFYYN